jgi:DNA polymerase I-like protein with 3'-5' exonuclease and polymerase domains
MSTEGFLDQRWSLEVAQREVLGWPDAQKETLKELLTKHRVKKSEMWKLAELEPQLFGEYCALDAEGAYQLWWELRRQADAAVLRWHDNEFLNLMKLLIEQQMTGIEVDLEGLRTRYQEIIDEAAAYEQEFLTHPEAVELVKEHLEAEVDLRWKSKEPTKYKKDGDISKNWVNWAAREAEIKEKYSFNIGSNRQLSWLFWENLYDVTDLGNGKAKLHLPGEDLIASYNKDGTLPVNKEWYPKLGELGGILAKWNDRVKLAGYVLAAIEKAAQNNDRGVIHPQFKIHGTLTGRLSGGGGLNLQQIPKDVKYLECYKPRKGHVWIQSDFTALEQVVLAEFSRDATMIELYASGVKHDVYLYNAQFCHPSDGSKIEAKYSPDTIGDLKKEFAKARKLIKACTLGFSYGMGPRTLLRNLTMQGYEITEEECRAIFNRYWELYKDVKLYEAYLQGEYETNGGWIRNGFGRPLAIAQDKYKDILNRFIQSTGHDILMRILLFIQQLSTERGVHFQPIICDFHDEFIFEIREDQVEDAKKIIEDAYSLLNSSFGDDILIPITGDIEIARNLAEIKVEGYQYVES